MGAYFQYQQRADPIQFGTAPTVPTQFAPSYPNILDRPLIRSAAALAPAFFFAFALTSTNIPPLGSWQPQYPNRIEAARALHPSRLAATDLPTVTTFDPGQRVDPVYPDRASGPNGLHASRHQALARDPFVVDITALSWSPVYPDRALGPVGLGVARHQSVARDPFIIDVVGLSWAPRYPVWVDRTRTAHPDAAVLPSFPQPDIAPLSWAPIYDPLMRVRPRATWFPPYAGPDQTPQTPLLAWTPVFPDRALGRPGLHPWLQQAFAHNLPPIAPPPVVPLSWKAVYPDRIFAHRVLAARIPFFSYVTSFAPTGAGAITLVEWASGDTLVAIEIEDVTLVPFSAP